MEVVLGTTTDGEENMRAEAPALCVPKGMGSLSWGLHPCPTGTRGEGPVGQQWHGQVLSSAESCGKQGVQLCSLILRGAIKWHRLEKRLHVLHVEKSMLPK